MHRRLEELGIQDSGPTVSPVVSVSIGVANGRCSSELSMELWISTPYAMLYQAKRSGRNRIEGHTMIPASDAEILTLDDIYEDRRQAG